MQVLIDINDDLYVRLFDNGGNNVMDMRRAYIAIRKGTVLPKGHGRLVDADVIDDNIYDLTRGMDLNYNQIISVLDGAPTIIPADKENEI